MKILSIETSCDETAISIVNFLPKNNFEILSDLVLSQIEIHKKYGGVYPVLAKREHVLNLFPVFFQSLKNADLLNKRKTKKNIDEKILKKLKNILNKDDHNLNLLIDFYEEYKKPKIKAIAITFGPGLEMALWTGFNFARAVSVIFNINLIPTNHMEGHIYASLIENNKNKEFKINKLNFPAVALLISGGHTELQLIKSEHSYKKLGGTLDDACGEAFDKTARLINVPYPGGPEISNLAQSFVDNGNKKTDIKLPRPMLNQPNLNFSFSGLKTAVLYLVKSKKRITEKFKKELSFEFENAVSEVLVKKTIIAIMKYKAKSLIIGGGVSANNRLRKDFKNLEKETEGLKVYLPDKKYTGDNGLMIAIAGYLRYKANNYPKRILKVNGNLKLK